MSNRSEYNNHLMFSLGDLKQSVELLDDKMFQCIVTFAAGGNNMPESMFLSYMHPVEIPAPLIRMSLAHFGGMKLFNVVCDCKIPPTCILEDIQYDEWYIRGKRELTENTERYIVTRDSIERLRIALEL